MPWEASLSPASLDGAPQPRAHRAAGPAGVRGAPLRSAARRSASAPRARGRAAADEQERELLGKRGRSESRESGSGGGSGGGGARDEHLARFRFGGAPHTPGGGRFGNVLPETPGQRPRELPQSMCGQMPVCVKGGARRGAPAPPARRPWSSSTAVSSKARTPARGAGGGGAGEEAWGQPRRFAGRAGAGRDDIYAHRARTRGVARRGSLGAEAPRGWRGGSDVVGPLDGEWLKGGAAKRARRAEADEGAREGWESVLGDGSGRGGGVRVTLARAAGALAGGGNSAASTPEVAAPAAPGSPRALPRAGLFSAAQSRGSRSAPKPKKVAFAPAEHGGKENCREAPRSAGGKAPAARAGAAGEGGPKPSALSFDVILKERFRA